MTDPIVYAASEGAGAWLSSDELYRYSLWRCWDPTLPPLVWVMCNPSTASAVKEDQTSKKCIGFATALGYGGISVVNLWAWRSRDPKGMRKAPHAVGDRNGEAIEAALRLAAGQPQRLAIAAWGLVARQHGPHYEDRVYELVRTAREAGVQLCSLAIGEEHTPSHPLTLPYSHKPEPWSWRGSWTCRDCKRSR